MQAQCKKDIADTITRLMRIKIGNPVSFQIIKRYLLFNLPIDVKNF